MDTSIVTFNRTRQQFVKKLFWCFTKQMFEWNIISCSEEMATDKKLFRGDAYLEGHSQSFFATMSVFEERDRIFMSLLINEETFPCVATCQNLSLCCAVP